MTNQKRFSEKTALYFEDQLDKVEGIIDLLEKKLGIKVVTAASPDEAFERMASHEFDLVILDIRIVGADRTREGTAQDWARYGAYFLQELREGRIAGPTRSSVPVLVISCVVNTTDKDRIVKTGKESSGRCRYLEKPVSLSAVEMQVDELLSS